ncbi:MAG TPA: hypothetical protein VGE01_03285, partial [Fimbriimonas sp.]
MKENARFQIVVGAVTVSLLALLIGCGGGGGGGSTIGGTNSTSGNTGGTNATGGNTGSTTGSTTGGDNSGTPGVLPPNKVFYSITNPSNGLTEIWHTDPRPESEGGVRTKFATLPSSNDSTAVVAFAPHPTVQNSFFFAYQASPGAQIGIYRSTTFNIDTATQIVAPSYSYVSQLQV